MLAKSVAHSTEVLADRPLSLASQLLQGGRDLVGEPGKLLHPHTIDGGSNAVTGGNA